MSAVSDALVAESRVLGEALSALSFSPPVAFVYNPLRYARAAHEQFIERFAQTRKRVVLVGMNPGPFGMAQTGVPFGEVGFVTRWMGIDAPIGRPDQEHPARPVLGYGCGRSEVSGARLWGAIAARFPKAGDFFHEHYVVNYCPLLFLADTGRNLTPDKLKKAERDPLLALCDVHLRAVLAALSPACVIGVGTWAHQRVRSCVGDDLVTGMLPHPSPASPLANAGWREAAVAALAKLPIAPFL